MGWLEFISKVIGAIAWPAVLIVLLIVLRRELRALVGAVERIKYKDFEAEFSKKAAELESKALALLQPTAKRPSLPAPTPDQSLDALVRTSPRLAVADAFTFVERAIRDAGARHGLDAEATRGNRETLRELRRRNLIPDEVRSVFSELRVVRDGLTHTRGAEISEEAARRFVNAAKALAQSIGQL